MMLNLLDSHDTHRFFTEIGKNKEKLLAALALEMVFPGAPCIYYGTEVCMEGGYDPDSRRCFPWKEEEWDHDFIAKVKELTVLRKREEIAYGAVHIFAENGMLCVKRSLKKDSYTMQVMIWINMEETAAKIPGFEEEKETNEILSQNNFIDGKLNANGFAVIKSKTGCEM